MKVTSKKEFRYSACERERYTMRITVLAIGSRGDVQPLLALAVGLQKTGRHRIRFAAPDNFESLVREDFVYRGILDSELPDVKRMRVRWSRIGGT